MNEHEQKMRKAWDILKQYESARDIACDPWKCEINLKLALEIVELREKIKRMEGAK